MSTISKSTANLLSSTSYEHVISASNEISFSSSSAFEEKESLVFNFKDREIPPSNPSGRRRSSPPVFFEEKGLAFSYLIQGE